MPAKAAAKSTTATPRAKKQTQPKLSFGPPTTKKNDGANTPKKIPANGNILNFFKKIDVEEQLFCGTLGGSTQTFPLSPTGANHMEDLYGVEEDSVKVEASRFNEDIGPTKRRKLSHDEVVEPSLPIDQGPNPSSKTLAASTDTPPAKPKRKPAHGKGPFLDDSDTDEDDAATPGPMPGPQNLPLGANTSSRFPADGAPPTDESQPGESPDPEGEDFKLQDIVEDQLEGFGDDMEGMFDDEYEDGDELRERRFMEEQARLEAGEAANYTQGDQMGEPMPENSMTENCPLCNASLAGTTPDQATQHVNACLDGNPIPVQAAPNSNSLPSSPMVNAPDVSKRFSKAAMPRPGQANPISLGASVGKPTSAFSKLMSGHAEDAAWASAAAAENASRGKPAYQRTCPFYKIMPGFFICVDAFRYGAVQGCNAYFLSHFHSDHYVGLTANWSHGPIYCSEVTASLIRSQLKTDAQWIKPLPFEEKLEIPGTQGVFVTMLSANHCPGSSLFLFEKPLSKGPSPKTQRVLHCGDFRACPAQVTHPILKPEIVDSISGAIKQQRIDVCYLDTTYLNPRYSFPPQHDVIQACADFCSSLSGNPSVADEAFDALKREKGSTTVSQFFQKEGEDSSGIQPRGQEKEDKADPRNRLLVVCGTYSIGKERICKAIAKALNTKIFASPAKIKICKQLGDPELAALMTSNPIEAQVHMQMLMELRAETLQDYLDGYKPHFTRIVGFRPSGWNFRSGGGGTSGAKNVPANASPSTVPTTQILHGPAWRTRFSSRDFIAQRGSTREAMCFGVPYSEHSSFRELALFLMSLRIEKVVPTVNIGNEQSRKRMKAWTDRWLAERRKGGLVKLLIDENSYGLHNGNEFGDKSVDGPLWDGKEGKGGGVWW